MAKSKKTKEPSREKGKPETLYCSFCGKSQHEVRKLIAGPEVYICDECVDLCVDIVRESRGPLKTSNQERIDVSQKVAVSELDKQIIGQQEAKNLLSSILLSSIANRTEVRESTAPRILVTGPTGAGKASLVTAMIALLGLPMARVDATTLARPIIISQPEAFLLLLQNADYNVERAQRGVVIVENVDRLTVKSGSETLSRQIQEELSVLLDGTIVSVAPQGGPKHPQQEFLQVDTTGVTFVLTSTLPFRYEFDTDRCGKWHRSQSSQQDGRSRVSEQELIECGFLADLVSRFDTVIMLEELSEEQLLATLKVERANPVQTYSQLYRDLGIKISMTEEALRAVAREAARRRGGTRAVRSLISTIVFSLSFEYPEIEKASEEITIDADFVEKVIGSRDTT